MNNAINSTSNVSFNSRYLKIKKADKIPQQIRDAIYKSDAIEDFLKAGEPKTLLGKIINLFKKDKALEVTYYVAKIKTPETTPSVKLLKDPYQKVEGLVFEFDKPNGLKKWCEIYAEQHGIERQSGSIPKPDEYYRYKPPIIKSEDELARKIESLKDLESLMIYEK